MRVQRKLVVCAAVFVCGVSNGWAQDGMDSVKDLYASAAYEEALSAVGKLEASAPRPEAAQYRVFCLVALGRMEEADHAAEALLTADPEYRPDASQASPRIESLFKQVRRRVAPGLVKRMYQEGRAAMEQKQREQAIATFEAMLRLASDADVIADGTVAELRDLGSGFLELSRAMPAPPPPAPLPAVASPPPSSRLSAVVDAVARQQRLPAWVPDRLNARAREFHGAIRVEISPEGKVTNAEIVKSVHAAYDQMLLRAARGWVYEPATKDGVPIASEKIVEVMVTPPKPRTESDKSPSFELD